MSKWSNSVSDPAGPIQAKKFNSAWRELNSEHNYHKELSGVFGVSESSVSIWSPFGHAMRAEVAAVQNKIGERFGWELSRKNVGAVVAAIESELPALAESRPVKSDTRRTAEQEEQRCAERAERERLQVEQRRAEELRWVELYGRPEAPNFEAPGGNKLVTVRLCYNNSDSMTDYHQPHATLSPEFMVFFVPDNKPETEAICRRALAMLPPELRALSWEWHLERWSMGHGAYLQSETFELSPEQLGAVGDCQRYGGGAVNFAHYEIGFKYSRACLAARLDPSASDLAEESQDILSAGAVQVSLNNAKSGVEVRFPDKPAEAILTQLKSAGFRWSRFGRCWYKSQTPESIAFARRLAGESCDVEKLREEFSDRAAGAYADSVCNSNFERASASEY